MLASSQENYKILVGGKPIEQVIRTNSSNKNSNDQQLLDLISKLEVGSGEKNQENQVPKSANIGKNIYAKITELQEAVEVQERLNLR